MKKLVSIVIVLIVLLSGCYVEPDDRVKGYPKIDYQNSQWEYDYNNMNISIPEGYILNQGHAYDIVETETGCDIVLHFIQE